MLELTARDGHQLPVSRLVAECDRCGSDPVPILRLVWRTLRLRWALSAHRAHAVHRAPRSIPLQGAAG
jgi:hypothetical protein